MISCLTFLFAHSQGILLNPNREICLTSLIRGCQERHRTVRYGRFLALPDQVNQYTPKKVIFFTKLTSI